MEPLLLIPRRCDEYQCPTWMKAWPFYCGVLGHDLFWRNDATGPGGVEQRLESGSTEIVLTTQTAL